MLEFPPRMATRHPHEGPPLSIHSMIEGRALLEFATLPWTVPLLATAPRGDGHPVLLLPGFIGDDATLFALKVFLRNRGYEVETWGFGRNVGFQRKHALALEQKVRYVHHRSGQPVSLVGWSLGGVFALYAAHQAPECVRNVVTLGSPVNVSSEGGETSAMVKALYRLIAHPMGPSAHAMQPRAKPMRRPPPLPMSCLYSLGDGVVPPQEATIDGDPAMHENIRVPGSHLGLGFNAIVLWIVADRLSQPQGAWQPFQPSGVFGQLYRTLTSAAVPA